MEMGRTAGISTGANSGAADDLAPPGSDSRVLVGRFSGTICRAFLLQLCEG